MTESGVLSSAQIATRLAEIAPSQASRRFAFNFTLKHVETMLSEMQSVCSEPEDIEHIHRMRVSSRKLRNALIIFQNCFPIRSAKTWRRQLQRLTQTLGAARDLDVQIESLDILLHKLPERKYKAGIQRILLRLGQQRQKTQKEVVDTVQILEKQKTLPRIAKVAEPSMLKPEESESDAMNDSTGEEETAAYPADLYRLADQAISLRLNHVLAFESFISAIDEDIEELHSMRKAAKWLRYTLEAFLPLYPGQLKPTIQAARLIQEYLGGIHDSDVWGQYIPLLLEAEKKKTLKFYGHLRPLSPLLPGINYFQHNWREERRRNLAAFVSAWEKWRAEGLFDNIRQITAAKLAKIELDCPEKELNDAPWPDFPTSL